MGRDGVTNIMGTIDLYAGTLMKEIQCQYWDILDMIVVLVS
jgi:hypothetical protein